MKTLKEILKDYEKGRLLHHIKGDRTMEGDLRQLLEREIHDAFEAGFHAGNMWSKEPENYPHKGIATDNYLAEHNEILANQ